MKRIAQRMIKMTLITAIKPHINILQTYKDAINSSKAIPEEIETIKENVFEPTYLPEGKKTLSGREIYAIKANPDKPEKIIGDN